MKIEKVILKRDARCRGPGQQKYCDHEMLRGMPAIKVSEFYSHGKMNTIYMCELHSVLLVEELEKVLKSNPKG